MEFQLNAKFPNQTYQNIQSVFCYKVPNKVALTDAKGMLGTASKVTSTNTCRCGKTYKLVTDFGIKSFVISKHPVLNLIHYVQYKK